MCSCCFFIEIKSKSLRFPTFVNASSLSEIVKTKNIRISNKNDVDRGSDCEVKRAGKLDIQIKSDWLLICLTFAANIFIEITWTAVPRPLRGKVLYHNPSVVFGKLRSTSVNSNTQGTKRFVRICEYSNY